MLNVGWNGLSKLDLSQFRYLNTLDISGNVFEELPADMRSSCPSLASLNAASNKLISLEDVQFPPTLLWIDLSCNKIECLHGSVVASWKRVKHLSIQENKLAFLPKECKKWTAMQFCNLRGNLLTEFPSAVSGWKSLVQLDVSHNCLTSLPSDLKCWLLCRSLDISHNVLIALPKNISLLYNIVSINASFNDLSNLPIELGSMPNLESLVVEGNPLNENLRLMASSGSLALLQCLRVLSRKQKLISCLPLLRSNVLKSNVMEASASPITGASDDDLASMLDGTLRFERKNQHPVVRSIVAQQDGPNFIKRTFSNELLEMMQSRPKDSRTPPLESKNNNDHSTHGSSSSSVRELASLERNHTISGGVATEMEGRKSDSYPSNR